MAGRGDKSQSRNKWNSVSKISKEEFHFLKISWTKAEEKLSKGNTTLNVPEMTKPTLTAGTSAVSVTKTL